MQLYCVSHVVYVFFCSFAIKFTDYANGHYVLRESSRAGLCRLQLLKRFFALNLIDFSPVTTPSNIAYNAIGLIFIYVYNFIIIIGFYSALYLTFLRPCIWFVLFLATVQNINIEKRLIQLGRMVEIEFA